VNGLKKLITDKKFRYGTLSTLTAALVIVVLVLVNVVVGRLDVRFDLSPGALYTIGEETKGVLSGLEDDVVIYPLFRTGAEGNAPMISEMLKQYEAHSSHVKVVPVDPVINTAFVREYTSEDAPIGENSIIVVNQNTGKSRVLTADKLQTWDTTYQYVSSYDVEPRVTNAIMFVTQPVTETVYALTGHGEYIMNIGFPDLASEAQYLVETLDLLQVDKVPDDCSVLVLATTSPGKDYTEEEVAKIMEYLEKGGRAIAMIDYAQTTAPNLYSVLAAYGVRLNEHLVTERDQNYVYAFTDGGQNYTTSRPILTAHAITDRLIEKKAVMLMVSQGIITLPERKSTTRIVPLLTSTNSAFGQNNPDPESVSTEMQPGDIAGPFTLAVAITDTVDVLDKMIETKLVVIGGSTWISGGVSSRSMGRNSEFFARALHWLTDRSEEGSVYVPSKTLVPDLNVRMTNQQVLNAKIFVLGVVPGAVITTGFVIWLRRRNK